MPLHVEDAEGTLLLQLIVHIFFADQYLDEREVRLVAKLVGGDEAALRRRIMGLGALPMDFAKLAELFPSVDDRQDIITLAEHAWWADNMLEPAELDVADKLAEVLDIHHR